MAQFLLKLLKACAIHAPKSSGHFAHTLQATLLPLVNKPNLNGGSQVRLSQALIIGKETFKLEL